MFTPGKPDDSSANVDVSFDHLSPQIRNVLQPQHAEFETELDTILHNYHDQMYSLFDRYPGAQEQMINVLRQQGVIDEEVAKDVIALTLLNTLFTQSYSIPQIFGRVQILPSAGDSNLVSGVNFGFPTYWCKTDNHRITYSEITSWTLDGESLCPRHHETLTALPDSFRCQEHNHSVSLEALKDDNWDNDGHPSCPEHHTILTAS